MGRDGADISMDGLTDSSSTQYGTACIRAALVATAPKSRSLCHVLRRRRLTARLS